ncbi:STAS domain-containing protein [Heliophilum fasciatum]|uniref:RsbT co-antagonist protein RsbR n=1 Tax=Heliophilum fasciatum TaxID=35700 RepID=A0A4V2SY68_9FIRM|nr:STAS domain-containing protein [Heliophilum fasciatum]MCW2276733.1 rsbT co-antagonist protein RsbR [Heliophilum fasciatum]TCP68886.1 rsbT co-antagonist protein RsbR [Heliophilum fasciatum]
MSEWAEKVIGIFSNRRDDILRMWLESQQKNGYRGMYERIGERELYRQSNDLFEAMIDAAGQVGFASVRKPEWQAVADLVAEITAQRTRTGFSVMETVTYVFALKTVLIEILRQEQPDDIGCFVAEVVTITHALDEMALIATSAYVKTREEIILRQQQEMLDLSTPVIRVWDGILVLPLIGTLDSSRSQVITETLLQEIVSSNSDIAILDISGVPLVDTLVAQHILKTMAAARLMGAECIISGIRPEIAQTIVHLGVDLSQIKTKATLAGALKWAFDMRQLTVVHNAKR